MLDAIGIERLHQCLAVVLEIEPAAGRGAHIGQSRDAMPAQQVHEHINRVGGVAEPVAKSRQVVVAMESDIKVAEIMADIYLSICYY